MSEESLKLPLAPPTTALDDVSLRSDSTGNSVSSKNAKNAIPHYLRASAGSCHDICKYGRRRTFKEKPWSPMRRRIAANPADSDCQSSAESVFLPSHTKKSLGVKLEPPSDTSSLISNSHELTKHKFSTKSQGSRRNSFGGQICEDRISLGGGTLSGRKKSVKASLDPSSDFQSQNSDSIETVKQEISTKPSKSEVPLEVEVSRRNSLGIQVCEDWIPLGSGTFSGRKSVKVSLDPSSDCQSQQLDSIEIVKQEILTKPSDSEIPFEDEFHDLVKAGILAEKNNQGTNVKPSSYSETIRSPSPGIVEHEESKIPRLFRNFKEPKFLSERKKITAWQKSGHSNAHFSSASEISKQGFPYSGKPKTLSKVVSQNDSARNSSSKIKPAAVKASSSTDSVGILNGKTRSGSKVDRRAAASNAAVKKLQAIPAASSKAPGGKVQESPRPSTSSKIYAKNFKASPTVLSSLRPVPARGSNSNSRRELIQKVPLKNRQNKTTNSDQPDVEEVAEKTLYVIEVATESKGMYTEDLEGHDEPHPCPLPIPTHQSSRAQQADEEECDDHFSEKREVLDKEVDSVRKESKRVPRNSAVDSSEGKDHKPKKLNFQRGKVIDIHSESNSPRRLKFRRGRILEQKQNVHINFERKSFKQREIKDSKSRSEAGSEKVVLRHQDMGGKKDAQGLLNNLIEETASKLIETRKSKVKALVGAFESVISSRRPIV